MLKRLLFYTFFIGCVLFAYARYAHAQPQLIRTPFVISLQNNWWWLANKGTFNLLEDYEGFDHHFVSITSCSAWGGGSACETGGMITFEQVYSRVKAEVTVDHQTYDKIYTGSQLNPVSPFKICATIAFDFLHSVSFELKNINAVC